MVVERQTSTTNFSKKLDHWIRNPIDRSGLMQVFAGLENSQEQQIIGMITEKVIISFEFRTMNSNFYTMSNRGISDFIL